MLDELEALPAPQPEALGITFGLREGPVPDRFLVGLAVPSRVAEAVEHRPLVRPLSGRAGHSRWSVTDANPPSRYEDRESVATTRASTGQEQPGGAFPSQSEGQMS